MSRFDSDKHIAYIGMVFQIEWYVNKKGESPSLDYAEDLSVSDKRKFMHLLEVMGDTVSYPGFDGHIK
jgi:hypothetical protein